MSPRKILRSQLISIIHTQRLKEIRNFKYLGSTIVEDGGRDSDINARKSNAKTVFNKVKSLLTNRSISLNLRKKFLRTFVWSTLLYGCEAWNISNVNQKKIEAAEMWFPRRMLRISWVEHATNKSVLQRAVTKRKIIRNIRQRQIKFLGHVIRDCKLEN